MIEPALFAYAGLVVVVVIAAVMDVRTGKVFNKLTYPAILAGFAYWAVFPNLAPTITWQSSLLAAAVAFIGCCLIILGLGGLGGGDLKLLTAIGAISGMWEVVLSSLFYALLVGAVIAIGLVIVKAHARMIFTATIKRILFRIKPDLSNAPPAPKIAFAACLAIGAIVAGAEQMLNAPTPWLWLTP